MIGFAHSAQYFRLAVSGMGEVYRARDARLERDVALKVVAGHVADDEDARRRLRKEALALSSLTHPNIAVVHDFDVVDGVTFVVIELVAGNPVHIHRGRGAVVRGAWSDHPATLPPLPRAASRRVGRRAAVVGLQPAHVRAVTVAL